MKRAAVAVIGVAALMVVLGLFWPSGGDSDGVAAPNVLTPRTSDPEPTPPQEPVEEAPVTPVADDTPATAERAPGSVAGLWPGAPAGVVNGETANWCAMTQAQPAAGTLTRISTEAVNAAACRAVAFVFDARYSRLSLPRASYTVEDFATANSFLSDRSRTRVYPGRIQAAIASPGSETARRGTGLILFNSASLPGGRTFFGGGAGYEGRAVWINPELSTVTVTAASSGRVDVTFDASAALPVWNPASSAAEQMSISTSARITMTGGGQTWQVESWSLETSRPNFSDLVLR